MISSSLAFPSDLVVIPFTSTGEWVAALIYLIFSFIGCAGVIIIMTATLKQANNLPSTNFIMSLCAADLILMTAKVIYTILDLHAGGFVYNN